MTQVHDDDLDNVFEFPENWDRDGQEAPATPPAPAARPSAARSIRPTWYTAPGE